MALVQCRDIDHDVQRLREQGLLDVAVAHLCVHGDGAMLWAVLEAHPHGHLTTRPASGRRPLSLAAAAGHVDCVRALLLHGAPTDAIDDDGLTALEAAILHGHGARLAPLADSLGCWGAHALISAAAQAALRRWEASPDDARTYRALRDAFRAHRPPAREPPLASTLVHEALRRMDLEVACRTLRLHDAGLLPDVDEAELVDLIYTPAVRFSEQAARAAPLLFSHFDRSVRRDPHVSAACVDRCAAVGVDPLPLLLADGAWPRALPLAAVAHGDALEDAERLATLSRACTHCTPLIALHKAAPQPRHPHELQPVVEAALAEEVLRTDSCVDVHEGLPGGWLWDVHTRATCAACSLPCSSTRCPLVAHVLEVILPRAVADGRSAAALLCAHFDSQELLHSTLDVRGLGTEVGLYAQALARGLARRPGVLIDLADTTLWRRVVDADGADAPLWRVLVRASAEVYGRLPPTVAQREEVLQEAVRCWPARADTVVAAYAENSSATVALLGEDVAWATYVRGTLMRATDEASMQDALDHLGDLAHERLELPVLLHVARLARRTPPGMRAATHARILRHAPHAVFGCAGWLTHLELGVHELLDAVSRSTAAWRTHDATEVVRDWLLNDAWLRVGRGVALLRLALHDGPRDLVAQLRTVHVLPLCASSAETDAAWCALETATVRLDAMEALLPLNEKDTRRARDALACARLAVRSVGAARAEEGDGSGVEWRERILDDQL